MNPIKSEKVTASSLDWLRWFLAIFLFALMVVANYYFSSQSVSLRIAGNILAGILVLAVVSFTDKGKQFWSFASEAKVELYKVVWPNRQETLQSTMLIVVFVMIAGLLLWGIDSLLLSAVSFMTGQ